MSSETPQTGIDLSQIVSLINQLLPVVVQVMVLGLAISLVFQFLLPTIKEAFGGFRA